jgi:hypothetical protein
MNAVEYLKAKARFCTGICNICPLNSNNNEEKLYCDDLEIERPEIAVEIVEKWAKENPVKTYKDVFLEKFPNATMGEDGCPTCCPTSLFNIEQECPKIPCVKCWNREYKEEANEN